MGLDLAFGSPFWVEIAVKMAATATLVVVATLAAERAGPLVGALIATLPIAAGPAFVFVSFYHDASFVSQAALASVAINAAIQIFCLTYVLCARSFGLVVSYGLALVVWVAAAALIQSISWTATSAVLLNIAVMAVTLPIAARVTSAPAARLIRRWYDVPFRAGLVAIFVALVVTLGVRLGPAATGMLAVFPIVLSSLIVILQPRLGGAAMSALIAHGMFGLVGFGGAALMLHLAAPAFGTPTALILALAVSLSWNLVLLLRRRAQRVP